MSLFGRREFDGVSGGPIDAATLHAQMPSDGFFVNFTAKEINTKILVLGAAGDRPRLFLDAVRRQVPSPVNEPDVYPMFSFLPPGLGAIRGFQVRTYLAGLAGPFDLGVLDLAVLGAGAIVLVSAGDARRDGELFALLAASPAYTEEIPLVIVTDHAGHGDAIVAAAPRAVVVREAPGLRTDAFPALRAALKLALERMRQPKKSAESVIAVPMPPLVDVLRALERAKQRPLTSDEVVDARDGALFIALTAANAKAMEERRGYSDVNPDHVWEEWQEARSRDGH